MFSESIRINEEIIKSQKQMIENNVRLISETEQRKIKMKQISADIDTLLKELGM